MTPRYTAGNVEEEEPETALASVVFKFESQHWSPGAKRREEREAGVPGAGTSCDQPNTGAISRAAVEDILKERIRAFLQPPMPYWSENETESTTLVRRHSRATATRK